MTTDIFGDDPTDSIPDTPVDTGLDYVETCKLHDEFDGSVTAVATVTCTDYANNRVSLRITDAATDKSVWVWMTAADALMLGGALQATGAVAGPAGDGDTHNTHNDSESF